MTGAPGRLAAAALWLACAPASAAAQAWLPPKGEGSVTIAYQGLLSDRHLDRRGEPYDRGRTRSHTVWTGIQYGLTELFSIDAKVAFVANKHEGADRLHGPLDTGLYHGTIQDARLSLAMQLPIRGSFAIAPFIGGVLPTHEYETRGHSSPGRRLKALQIGAAAGRDLAPLLPKAYIQGQYSFAIVERVGGMSINRSVVDVDGGYAIGSAVTVTVAATVQRTHGGLEFPLPRDEHYDDVFPFHDRVARDDYFLVSAGATVAISRRMSVYGTMVHTVNGRNTHHVRGLTTGLSWSFGRELAFGR